MYPRMHQVRTAQAALATAARAPANADQSGGMSTIQLGTRSATVGARAGGQTAFSGTAVHYLQQFSQLGTSQQEGLEPVPPKPTGSELHCVQQSQARLTPSCCEPVHNANGHAECVLVVSGTVSKQPGNRHACSRGNSFKPGAGQAGRLRWR